MAIADPWSHYPRIPELDLEDRDLEVDDPRPRDSEPPCKSEINEDNILMLRRQSLFRWGAQSIAVASASSRKLKK